MKVLTFKLYGDYGHYRPYYTTSSPTTYSLMPPTTIIGLVGAVLGLEKQENAYYSELKENGIKVGIGLDSPVKKVTMSTNLINTKGNYWVPTQRNTAGPRTPTRFEYVKNQVYRIYVTMENETCLDELADRIKEHRFAYTVSLGLAGLLADIEYIHYGHAEYVTSDQYIFLDSAIAIQDLQEDRSIEIIEGIQYCKERYVEEFTDNRVPLDYVDVLFAANAAKISVKCKGAYKLQDKIFTFLN